MGISHSEAYAAAGVDIEAGYQGVKMMNRYVQRTLTADVISDLGGFGGLFRWICTGLKKPVLVSGTDGVGTKQRIAQLMDRHNTVGIDCVAMCVNDIICCGGEAAVLPRLHRHRQEHPGKGRVAGLGRIRGLCARGLRAHRRRDR